MWAAAWNEILEHRPDVSFRATPDNLKKLFGRPLPVIASMIFTKLSKPEYLELIQKCTDNEHEFLHKIPGKLFSGVRETLLALKEQYPLYIVSNCEAGYIETFLEATGLGDCFLDHECPGSSGKYKAENIRLIVERNTISHPVYIGDTDGDAQACQEAGVAPYFRRVRLWANHASCCKNRYIFTDSGGDRSWLIFSRNSISQPQFQLYDMETWERAEYFHYYMDLYQNPLQSQCQH